MTNSKVKRAIAYVQEVLITEYDASDTFYEITGSDLFSAFSQNQFKVAFKACKDDGSYEARYLLMVANDPHTSFDDSILQALESVSPFVIVGNRGPIIFTNNEFRDNIGT